ncbi:MAG TPA: low molecular weight phosphatase family protein [Mycobacteriales bacterium]|nr:low molecular weight phosphatase family protein [Mycobacteriales bacterium]
MTDDVFRVLHVCTGNICRSPMAERLMHAMVGAGWPEQAGRFVVESAGTWGHSGSPMEPHALSTLAGLGVDGSAFRARELEAEHVTAADLVLTATREHRAAAVVLHPRAAARTFTLLEFARLTAGADASELPAGDAVDRARALVRLAASRRGLVPPERPGDDDLADPYQAPASAFAATAELVRAALRGPVDLLVAGRRIGR